jgi:hypothetical protein
MVTMQDSEPATHPITRMRSAAATRRRRHHRFRLWVVAAGALHAAWSVATAVGPSPSMAAEAPDRTISQTKEEDAVSRAGSLADLLVAEATAPAAASTQQAVAISWTVRNAATAVGGAATAASWQDSVYLSTQPVCCDGAVLLGSFIHSGGLGVGASYQLSPTVTMPNVSSGNYHLIIWTDATNAQDEANDSNNQRVLPIAVTEPDLVLTALARVPASASTQQAIPVSWTVQNQGTGPTAQPWEDGVYLSPNPTCCAGAIQLGAWPRPAGLAARRQYAEAKTVAIPNVDPGHYYVIARANAARGLHESQDANNERAIALTVTTPDLAATGLSAPPTAASGQSVPVTWTVDNAGGAAVGTWVDALYLAQTPTCCSGAALLGRWEHSKLAAAARYTQTKAVTIPGLAEGRYYLILRTDAEDDVHEINEANNERSIPLAITGADLVPTALTAPASATGGKKISVSWAVENHGDGLAAGPWVDKVLISSSPTCCASASEVGSWRRPTALAAHKSYAQTKSVLVPNLPTGIYYLIFWADADRQVPEANDENNWRASRIAVTTAGPIPGPTSLAVASVNGGDDPTAGTGFAVVVQTRDTAGIRRNVANPTAVALRLVSGTGALGGALTGTIPAGASEVALSGATYTKAESGVTLAAHRTAGDALADGKSEAFAVRPGPIASYALGVSSPQTAGIPFSIDITARDQFGNKVNADSAVSMGSVSGHVLFDADGDGVFGDTTKALAAGSVRLAAKAATAETTRIVATDARGITGSVTLAIVAGPARALAFETQPSGAMTGSPIPGPPTVAVQDAFGNLVRASTAVIGVAIGTNPTASSLSGTTVRTAVNGIAGFTDLSIGRPGTYTLTATAPGLLSATSAAFTIGSDGGGISGRVARASDGTGLAGAVVSALQAGLVKGSVTTTGDGAYVMSGVAAGTYDVRASASGFQTQIATGIAVSAGISAIANFSLSAVAGPTIRITEPVSGSAINRLTLLVRGEITAPQGTDVGVSVNDVPGFVDGSRFAALVAVQPGTTVLVANLTGFAGAIATDSIPITVEVSAADPPVNLRAVPAAGLSPLTIGFSLWSSVGIADISLDVNGDGSADFHGQSLDAARFVLAQPGIYTPRATIIDSLGRTHDATTVVEVFDAAALDRRLQAVWRGVKDALRAGNTAGAVALIHSDTRDRYREQFDQLSAATLASVDSIMTDITFVGAGFGGAQYEMVRQENGQTFSYAVWFLLDQDGLWRLRRF